MADFIIVPWAQHATHAQVQRMTTKATQRRQSLLHDTGSR